MLPSLLSPRCCCCVERAVAMVTPLEWKKEGHTHFSLYSTPLFFVVVAAASTLYLRHTQTREREREERKKEPGSIVPI